MPPLLPAPAEGAVLALLFYWAGTYHRNHFGNGMKTQEYFIIANSFAAPFFSDQSTHYIKATSPRVALEKLAKTYKHPCGLYCANCYASADDYHKNKPHLAQWLSNAERAKQEATKDLDCYSMYGESPGRFRVNDKWIDVKKPKDGAVV